MKHKTIANKNSKKQWHGYQVRVCSNGDIRVRGCWKNDIRYGYIESHFILMQQTKYHIR
jgi:hypothetical protein